MTEFESLLVAYADGELDAAATAEVERILDERADARRLVAIYRETASLLRAACAESIYAAAPSPIRAPAPRARASRWLSGLAIAASVAALAIGFAAGLRSASHGGNSSFIDEVAEYHEIYSRETTHLAEVPATQAVEIANWLEPKLQRRVSAPDLRAQGLQFAGARLWVGGGHPVADLLYTRLDGLPVAFCIVHATSAEVGTDIEISMRGDLHVASWQQDGYTYAVVGDLTVTQAREIAERARRASQG